MTPGTSVFLVFLGATIAVWVMRGIGILTFIPGGILWVLLFATIGAGVVEMLRRSKRW